MSCITGIATRTIGLVWEMVKRGLGVGLMSREIALRTEGVVDLFPDLDPPRFPVWIVTHRELRTSRRIRLVYEILAEELARVECLSSSPERA
jgi:DNA-binding transcriptional LysR family regulator